MVPEVPEGSGKLRRSCVARFRKVPEFRKVPRNSSADVRQGSGRFSEVAAQLAGSGSGGSKEVAVQLPGKDPEGSGGFRKVC